MKADMTEVWGWLQRILEFPLLRLQGSQLTILDLLKLVILLVLVLVLERFLRRMVMAWLLRQTKFEPSLQYAIGKFTGYVFITLGGYVALTLSGINLSSLAILAGAVGVGLGFGLQNIVSNFISGLIILAERPIAIGDRVEIGNIAGQVAKISLRSTTVITNDNISIIVPNSDFVTSTVTNWSHGDPRVRMRLPVGVAYGTDIDKLRQAMLEVAAAHPKVLREPAPELFFLGFGDSSLNFELAVWTSEMTAKPRRFRSELYYAMEKKLRQCGIEIPFPQRDLHLRGDTFPLQLAASQPTASAAAVSRTQACG
jgi:small-conductance mechanosensitive channel